MITKLDDAARSTLCVLSAPPGYGKTTLLSQWAASRAHAGVRLRWISLTGTRNRGPRFVADLEAALGCSSSTPGTVRRGRAPERPTSVRRVSDVLDDLGAIPPTTVVIDNFHLLTDRELLIDLGVALAHASPDLHVVIATRTEPPVPAHRLRLADSYLHLGQQDLALTDDEAAQLLSVLSPRGFSAAQIHELVSVTAGWPLGLVLAADRLRAAPDVDAEIAALAHGSAITAYFRSLLEELPPPMREFVLGTSVLDRLSAPLCDHVMHASGGEGLLDQVANASLFVQRGRGRDEAGYHPLFRSVLQAELRRLDPDREREYLLRAADWYRARDDLETAMAYLERARDWDGVVDLAGQHALTLSRTGRAATLTRWLRAVPLEHPARTVRADLLEAASLMHGVDCGDAWEVLERVQAASGATPGERVVAALLRAQSAVHRADFCAARHEAAAVLRDVEAIDDDDLPDVLGLTRTRADVAAAAQLTCALALVHEVEPESARPYLRTVLQSSSAYSRAIALGLVAWIEARCGNLRDAERLAAQAEALVRHACLPPDCLTTPRLARAIVARQRGRLDEARQRLDETLAQATEFGREPLEAWIGLDRAIMALREGEPAEGLRFLAGVSDAVIARSPLLTARRRAVEGHLRIELGDLAGAEAVLRPHLAIETSALAAARVKLVLARNDPGAARALLARWPRSEQPRSGLEHDLWLAVLEESAGHFEPARELLEGVVRVAQREWDVGLFDDPSLVALARGLHREAPSGFLGAVVTHAVPPGSRTSKRLVEQLTAREYFVLALLPSRLSNVEIAERADVSLNTLKTHLKHIYRKLGASKRSEAVSAAERVRLL